ncbi:unnamed protein product (macronuclear) [Paramecium tetraurelia]|uniref:Glutaredoxin domain-containing protein n=1 Tax=Paramecium tetraurelia TaxID=5888 RepID=A0BB68_PARTE|nr:uncharacterized protein GSPATT00000220001 [Paramecium tetraurelia]CAK55785.1 unnamed protein product [Paramecium tetraurelia]|eukprot:XP_001423183.1 hypothetical protein (macronuclear) [Paramecium tetraurelia strain d4-2]
MTSITQEYSLNTFQSSNFHKVIITVFYNNDDYKARLDKLLQQIPLDVEKYALSYCNDEQIARSHNIHQLPSVLISSYPQLINSQILSLEPAQIVVQLESIFEQFEVEFRNQQKHYFQKIEQMIKENPIMLFIVGTPEKPMCRFTSKLIQKLQPFGIQFGFYDIEIDKLMVGYLKLYSKWQTFPQVFVSGKLIGGADATVELIEQKRFAELIPKEAYMTKNSKLEQIQLISKYIILIDGQPDLNCEIARILSEKKIPFQFYNIGMDQEVRSEVLNFMSSYIETSHDLEPLLLYKNTIYNEITLKKELSILQ